MAKRNAIESAMQKQVVEWLQYQENVGRLTYFSVPNNPRNAITGWRQKQEGMRAGTPDLQILAKNRIPLFIELKAPKGQLSDAQELAADRLTEHGALVVVCRSFDQVKRIVEEWYFNGSINARAA